MKIITYGMLICLIFAWGMSAEAQEDRALLILADVSGSMQDMMETYRENSSAASEEHEMTKVGAEKELLVRLIRELSPMVCDTGIYPFRYLSGNPKLYEPFMEIRAYDHKDMTTQIADEFVTDYPVFNRRTPIADMLRQLDEQDIEAMKRPLVLLLISDGNETFHNLKTDDRESQKGTIDPDDKVRGPLTEVRRLKQKYGGNLVLHTVFMDRKKNKNDEVRGESLLKKMASAGAGKFFNGAKLLEDPSLMTELAGHLCKKEPAKVARAARVMTPPPPEEPAAMPPPPEALAEVSVPPPVIVEPQGPADSDGDGVYDPDDKCPATPLGAKVNHLGCWVLEGVLFDFDKWNIKPQYHPDMNDVVVILEKNPGLKVVIEGHTDIRGTAAYNQKLSERRARSVMNYLTDKGIEPGLLSIAGYGFTKPVATNKTSEGRALNRRVELKPIW